jgi:hypothetical protein
MNDYKFDETDKQFLGFLNGQKLRILLCLIALFALGATAGELIGYDIGAAKLRHAEQNATNAHNALANCEATQGGLLWEPTPNKTCRWVTVYANDGEHNNTKTVFMCDE